MSWITTPWGDAWIGPGPRPADPPKVEPPPPPPPFVPTYETATIDGPNGASWLANQWFFATAETAAVMAEKLYALAIVDVDTHIGGFFSINPPMQRFLVFSKADSAGKLHAYQVNAGLLAANWTRNPEDKFPGLALKLAQWAVEEAGRTLLGF